MRPVVSIICLTYNHRAFIRQTLDGFVMQQTDFPFEILVHDDASNDGTSWIVKEYAERYPGMIAHVLQTENQFRKTGVYPISELYRIARGRYVANCDGDDYWTDPAKLQRQVEVMDEDPGCVMTHHAYKVSENGVLRDPDRRKPRDFTASELIGFPVDGYGIGSCTKMWRNLYTEKTRKDWEAFVGDYPMNVLLGHYGGCRFVEGIKPSVYRRLHASSSWCSLPGPEKARKTREMFRRIHEMIVERGNPQHIKLRQAFL